MLKLAVRGTIITKSKSLLTLGLKLAPEDYGLGKVQEGT